MWFMWGRVHRLQGYKEAWRRQTWRSNKEYMNHFLNFVFQHIYYKQQHMQKSFCNVISNIFQTRISTKSFIIKTNHYDGYPPISHLLLHEVSKKKFRPLDHLQYLEIKYKLHNSLPVRCIESKNIYNKILERFVKALLRNLNFVLFFIFVYETNNFNLLSFSCFMFVIENP